PPVARPAAAPEVAWPAPGIPAPRPESDTVYASASRPEWTEVASHAQATAAAFAAAGYGQSPGAGQTPEPSPYGAGPNGYHGSPAPNGHPGPEPTRGSGWEQQFGPAPQSAGAAPTSLAPQSYGPDTLSFSTDPLTAPLA